MIQENTTQRFHSLGVLLLLDAPPGIELGIDNISWKIGSKFKGIKMIPLGTHIITYSLASQNHMFKISKFLIFSNEQRILVYKWNQDIFEFCKVKGEDAEGYITGVKHYHFDAHLGPYPQSNLGFWAENTKYINKETIDKLDPIDKLYRFENQYNKKKQKKQHQNMDIDEDQNEQNIDQNIEIEVQKEAQPENTKENIGKFQELSDTIYYSYIPRFLKGQPESITKVNMDKTPILKRILSKEWKNKQQQFLAELQYSFIHFIIAENQQSLEQWKKIIDLIVFSESAFLTIRQLDNDLNLQKLIMDFIPVLYEQLNQFPVDFFRDELSKTSFMVGIMKQLKLYSKGQQYSLKIRKRIKKLLELVKAKFDYIVHSQDEEEDKPILVNQNESYF